MSIQVISLEGICRWCALEKEVWVLDRVCEDCWERMHNAD